MSISIKLGLLKCKIRDIETISKRDEKPCVKNVRRQSVKMKSKLFFIGRCALAKLWVRVGQKRHIWQIVIIICEISVSKGHECREASKKRFIMCTCTTRSQFSFCELFITRIFRLVDFYATIQADYKAKANFIHTRAAFFREVCNKLRNFIPSRLI